MRIILASPTFLPARRANTIQVMKMAEAFTQLGHPLEVLVPTGPDQAGGSGADWPSLADQYGLEREFPVVWLAARPIWRGVDFASRVLRYAQRQSADLIFTRHPQTAGLAARLGQAVIYELHDLPMSAGGRFWLRLFLKSTGRRGLVAISRALAADLLTEFRIPAAEILIAPDGVDLRRYQDLPEPRAARQALQRSAGLPLAVDRFTLGYTGHLYPGRGVDLILGLAAQLKDVSLLIAGGEDVDRIRLEERVRRAGLENIILAGHIPNAQLPLYQAACDILLMPYQRRVASSSGGDIARYLSPMKVFEYMACGRAILSSDLPALQEVLTPQNAVLLPGGEVGAWAAAVNELRNSPEKRRRLAEQARRDVRQYEWKIRAEKILADTSGPHSITGQAGHVE